MKSEIRFRLAVVIGATLVVPFSLPGKEAESRDHAKLSVHVYDLAGVPKEQFEHAMKEAGAVFYRTGVEVDWVQGSAEDEEARVTDQSSTHRGFDTRPYLVVRVIAKVPERTLPHSLGFTLINAQFGANCTLFWERIQNLKKNRAEASIATILGHAMAHEIGHALLETLEHSNDGLMKASWGDKELGRAAMGLLNFSSIEREKVRGSRRLLAPQAFESRLPKVSNSFTN